MKTPKKIRVAVALLACVGMLSPAAAFGAVPTKVASVKDTKLTGDALVGKVVDAQGNAVASAKVAVRQAGQAAKVVATDANGQFSIAGLNGGVYQVMTQGTTANYRVWTAAGAPPVATAGILLVDDAAVTRGQCAGGGCANSAPAYGGGAVYGAPVEMAAPVYGGGVAAPAYGGGEVVYGGGGGCDGGGGGAAYPADAGYVVDGGYGAGYGGGGGYVDAGYGAGGACGPAGCGGGGLGGFGGGGGGFLGFLSSPWVIGAGVAAAIAIPLALDDDDDNNAAGNGNGNGSGNGNGGAAS